MEKYALLSHHSQNSHLVFALFKYRLFFLNFRSYSVLAKLNNYLYEVMVNENTDSFIVHKDHFQGSRHHKRS